MVISRKLLISFAATAIVLFIVANPLGDAHHGLGKHNRFYADLGQTLFFGSLIVALAFIVLAVVALIQLGMRRSRRVRS
jgi:hypothetical protein